MVVTFDTFTGTHTVLCKILLWLTEIFVSTEEPNKKIQLKLKCCIALSSEDVD